MAETVDSATRKQRAEAIFYLLAKIASLNPDLRPAQIWDIIVSGRGEGSLDPFYWETATWHIAIEAARGKLMLP